MTKTTFAQGQLRSFVERIERLEEEKKTIAGDIKEVYAEAKANGFDTKILRKVIALRKIEAAEREEQQSMLDVYLAALGMLADTPLGQAALDREGIKATATRLRMEDTASLSQNLADAGLISQEAADETRVLSQAINDKWGDGKPLETRHEPA